MGVIYKLKEDVIAFIIDQKKRNPSDSIRKISTITSEKFQIKVSKSSVNAILKGVSLSSAIGRRPGSVGGATKFTIPPDKKVEILMNIQKTGFAGDKAAKKRKNDDAAEGLIDKKEEVDIRPIKKEEMLSLSPDLMKGEVRPSLDTGGKDETSGEDACKDKDFFERVKRLRDEKKRQNGGVLNGMGFIFLKAAQWELLSKPFMSELFKSHVSTSFHGSFDASCEMFLFLKFLGAQSFDHVSDYCGHGLWKLNKFTDENDAMSDLSELFQWSANITDALASSIVMEYDLEKKYISLQASGFELLIEDGTKLMIDADMSSLSLGSKVPINKSIAWLSNYLISNVSSPVFFTVPGKKTFDRTFYDMVAVFENFPGKKIQKAVILDQNNREITEFSTIPVLRRNFLAGVTPQQKEFSDLTKNSKWAAKVPFYHQGSDRVVFYGETKTDSLGAHLREKMEDFRVISVWQNKEDDPFWAILTNQRQGSGEDILKAYMSRWPYFGGLEQEVRKNDSLYNIGKEEGSTTHKCGKLEFEGIFSDFVGILSRHCQQHYFLNNYSDTDISDMVQAVYEMRGSLHEEKDCIIVSLDVPAASQYRKDIEWALRRVNERHIFDHFGRKLWIEA